MAVTWVCLGFNSVLPGLLVKPDPNSMASSFKCLSGQTTAFLTVLQRLAKAWVAAT